MQGSNPKDYHQIPKVPQCVLVTFSGHKIERSLIWLPICVTILVWSHVTAKQSHVHYFSSVHMRSCSIAFKFGRIISYINVHAEVNFKSKNIYTSKAMVLFVLSAPKIRCKLWLSQLYHQWAGSSCRGIQVVRTAPFGYFWLSSCGSAKPSQALATLACVVLIDEYARSIHKQEIFLKNISPQLNL